MNTTEELLIKRWLDIFKQDKLIGLLQWCLVLGTLLLMTSLVQSLQHMKRDIVKNLWQSFFCFPI